MTVISANDLQRFSRVLPPARAALYADILVGACTIAALNTPQRLCNFMGQVGEETGGLSSLVESTAYADTETNAAFLAKTFRNVHGLDHARRLLVAGPVAIGNAIYALKNGNGDMASGDGYRYRGRGFLQVSGRAGYRSIGKLIGQPLEQQPDLLADPSAAAQAAASYWALRNINVAADADDVGMVTQLVNGYGRLHQAQRRAWHDKARQIWPF